MDQVTLNWVCESNNASNKPKNSTHETLIQKTVETQLIFTVINKTSLHFWEKSH